MTYGVIHVFPGGTQSQYDKTVGEVHPAGGGLPEGQLFHAAGASEGGWTIVAVHDSKDSWGEIPRRNPCPTHAEGH